MKLKISKKRLKKALIIVIVSITALSMVLITILPLIIGLTEK
ncbi:MAG: hypothetical protein V1655_01095 [bacterium]